MSTLNQLYYCRANNSTELTPSTSPTDSRYSADNRTDWDPADLQAEKHFPIEFDCGGESYAFDVNPDVPPQPDKIQFRLLHKVGDQYVPDITSGGSKDGAPGVPNLKDTTTMYIGPDADGKRVSMWFPSTDRMLAYVKGIRVDEPGAKREQHKPYTARLGTALEFSVGGHLLTHSEELSDFDALTVNGGQVTPEQNAFGGGGFELRLGIGSLDRYPLKSDNPLGIAGLVLSIVGPELYVSTLWATGNEHLSANPGEPAKFSLIEGGLDFALGLRLRTIRQAASLAPLDFDIGFVARTSALAGGCLTGAHWAIEGSSKETDFSLCSDPLFTPGDSWELALYGTFATSGGDYGVEVAYRPERIFADSGNYAFGLDSVIVSLKGSFPAITQEKDEITPWKNDTINLHPSARPKEIPAPVHPVPEPAPVQDLPPVPPPPEKPVVATKVPLKDLSGLQTRVITYYNEGESAIIDETALTEKVEDLFIRAEDVTGQTLAELVQQGWRIGGKLLAGANSHSGAPINLTLSKNRGLGVKGQIGEIGVKHKFPLDTEALQVIGRGEYIVRDPSGNEVAIPATAIKHIDKGACKGTERKGIITRTCGGLKFEEDIQQSRSVETILWFLPPGTPNFQAGEGTPAIQLATDRQYGPGIARALKGGGKFPNATYDPEANRLYVSVNSFDPKKIAAWKRVLDRAPNAKKVSFTVEPIVQVDFDALPDKEKTALQTYWQKKGFTLPQDWRKIIQTSLYKFGQSPWAGGIDPRSEDVKSKFESLATKAKETARGAKTISDAMWNEARTVGDATVYFRAWNADTLPMANKKAVYQLVKRVNPDASDRKLLVLVNRHPAASIANALLQEHATNLGYAAQFAQPGSGDPVLTRDDRLPNGIYLVAVPKGSTLDLTKPNDPATKALFDQLKTAP